MMKLSHRTTLIFLAVSGILLAGSFLFSRSSRHLKNGQPIFDDLAGRLDSHPASMTTPGPQAFDGQRALEDIVTQISFGPRIPGSRSHARVVSWIQSELKMAGWSTQLQSTRYAGHPIENITAFRSSQNPQVILAAHYDSRIVADQDTNPAHHTQAVPGANDGASGVAVLLELSRTLPEDIPPLWLVFLDAEDNGQIEDWDWILGSRAYAAELQVSPQAIIIIDMIGDADLNIYKEYNSDPLLTESIWEQAAELGYMDVFIPEYKYRIVDDHIPFIEAGFPAIDIIDFDYPYWHTLEDTPDKVSAESLEIVGNTLWHWLTQPNR
ncbi:MAG: M28 family peptidase [Anaerolineales bacterium]|nr:M28 family peptidase [Anaerolineales bacterium]